MIQIGVATVRFSYEPLDEAGFRRLSLLLFDVVNTEVQDRIRFEDVKVILEVEESSVRARTKILVGAASIGAFLGQYGSIRQGAEYLAKDVMTIGRSVIAHVIERAGASPGDVISSRSSATLTKRIRNVVEKVEQGELSADAATGQLLRLLDPDNEGVLSRELLQNFDDEIHRLARRTMSRQTSVMQELLPLTVVERNRDVPRIKALPVEPPAERPRKPKRLRVFLERNGRTSRVRVEED